MKFIKIDNDNWLIKNSNGRVVSNDEKLKLERKELIIEDIYSNDCQGKTTKKISKINKEIEKNGSVKKAKQTAE